MVATYDAVRIGAQFVLKMRKKTVQDFNYQT